MKNSKKLVGGAIYIVIFSLIGKVLGFLRESFIAARFGATLELDAFSLSQSAIAMIASIITAAIATTFIPMLQKVESELGEEKKLYFTSNMIAIVSVLSLIATAIVVLIAPQISFLFTFDKSYEGFDLITNLIVLSAPSIIFSALTGIFMGYLQYEGSFAVVGAIAIPLNLVNIFYLLFFSKDLGIKGLTVAGVIAVLMQVVFLIPSAIKKGYRPKLVFDLKDKYVLNAVVLSLPVFVSSSIDNINSIINRSIALRMKEGSVSVLSYANRLNIMIIGIFITAITAVIFPVMSRAFGSNNIKEGKKVVYESIKLVLLLTIPAAIGMFIMARPIVEIAFLHGKFTMQNAVDTTLTLRCYSLSLVSLSLISVLNRAFYALSDTKTPFIVGIFNVIMNISINLLVAKNFGTEGLAASVSISTSITSVILFIILRKKLGRLGTKSYIKTFIKSIMASFTMGVFCLIYFEIEKLNILSSTFSKFIILSIVVFIAVIIYVITLYFLGVKEVVDLKNILNRKLKKLRK